MLSVKGEIWEITELLFKVWLIKIIIFMILAYSQKIIKKNYQFLHSSNSNAQIKVSIFISTLLYNLNFKESYISFLSAKPKNGRKWALTRGRSLSKNDLHF